MRYCPFCMNVIGTGDVICGACGKFVNEEVPTHHLKPGTILYNKIYIGASLGEGGFGITYIGRDLNLDIKVAVKEFYPNGYVNRANTISPNLSCGGAIDKLDFFEKGKERFLQEARVLAKFSKDPGVVEVRDFFEENNTAYIVMEFLEGIDLKEFLKRNGRLTPNQTLNLLMPVMDALRKIHAQGLIHRDISPDNIRLVDGGVRLLDFGAARDMSAVANRSLSIMLKPGYAPEEQYRSRGNQGPWTDVYALCATMYKCITGVTPDDSTQRLFNDELKTPTELGITIDPTFEYALMKGLAVVQNNRCQSIDELLALFQGKGVEIVEDEDKTVAVNSDDKTIDSNNVVNYNSASANPNMAYADNSYDIPTVAQTNFNVVKDEPVVVEQVNKPKAKKEARLAKKFNSLTPEQKESIRPIYRKYMALLISVILVFLIAVTASIIISSYMAQDAKATYDTLVELTENSYSYDASLWAERSEAFDEYFRIKSLGNTVCLVIETLTLVCIIILRIIFKKKYPYFTENLFYYMKKQEKLLLKK